MTTGERLAQISGLSGVSAAVMMLAIGSGVTTGEALVDYSGLATGTAEQHLLVERAAAVFTGGRRQPRVIWRPAPQPALLAPQELDARPTPVVEVELVTPDVIVAHMEPVFITRRRGRKKREEELLLMRRSV